MSRTISGRSCCVSEGELCCQLVWPRSSVQGGRGQTAQAMRRSRGRGMPRMGRGTARQYLLVWHPRCGRCRKCEMIQNKADNRSTRLILRLVPVELSIPRATLGSPMQRVASRRRIGVAMVPRWRFRKIGWTELTNRSILHLLGVLWSPYPTEYSNR